MITKEITLKPTAVSAVKVDHHKIAIPIIFLTPNLSDAQPPIKEKGAYPKAKAPIIIPHSTLEKLNSFIIIGAATP